MYISYYLFRKINIFISLILNLFDFLTINCYRLILVLLVLHFKNFKVNRLVFFIFFFIFFSLDAVSQISHDANTDTVILNKELHFQDSIAKLNTVNRNLKKSRDAFNDGISFFESNLYKKAVKAYTEAISLDSLFIDAYYNRAKAYQLDLDTMLAVKDCDRLLAIDSTYLDALYLYAELYKKIDAQLPDYFPGDVITSVCDEMWNEYWGNYL